MRLHVCAHLCLSADVLGASVAVLPLLVGPPQGSVYRCAYETLASLPEVKDLHDGVDLVSSDIQQGDGGGEGQRPDCWVWFGGEKDWDDLHGKRIRKEARR